jgi:hypothetical protein
VQIQLFTVSNTSEPPISLSINADALLKEAKQQFQDFVLGKKKSNFAR